MKRLRLTPAALNDLREIGHYTEQRWGAERRSRYLRGIDQRLKMLGTRPELGVARDDVRAGYRMMLAGSHLVVYRVTADSIEIARILHESMDLRRHLSDRSK